MDPVFQTNMLEMLKQTGRPQMVVGWYHSHPGFGCWLSGVDMNTQTSFEQLNARAVAVVVDPVQSVKVRPPSLGLCLLLSSPHLSPPHPVSAPPPHTQGKVVIDAFRMFGGQNQMMMMAPPSEPRQTTSTIGFLKKPTIQARIHHLDKYYYSLVIDWRKNDLEEQMLMNLHKKVGRGGKGDGT